MRHRFTRQSHLPACASLIHPGLAPPDRLRARLPSIWGRLLEKEQMISLVIEDPGASGFRAVVGFGMSVFASDAFLAAYLAAPHPHLAARIYEELEAGRSPILSIEQIRQANSTSGLSLIVLHFGQREIDPRDPETMAALAMAHQSFRLAHEGYRINRVLHEACGDQLEVLRAGGHLVKSDFAAAYGSKPPTPERRSWLCGLYRDDRETWLPGATLAFLFRPLQVKFGFTAAEQRILLRALVEEVSDEEIAADLGVSVDAVKKLWRSVYHRVSAAESGIFGRHNDDNRSTRGRERRRHLLAYLQSHLEELRPRARTANSRAVSRRLRPPSTDDATRSRLSKE